MLLVEIFSNLIKKNPNNVIEWDKNATEIVSIILIGKAAGQEKAIVVILQCKLKNHRIDFE